MSLSPEEYREVTFFGGSTIEFWKGANAKAES